MTFAHWINNRLQFVAPVSMTRTHVILVFEFPSTRKVVCTVSNSNGAVNNSIANCDPGLPGTARDHMYWVVPNPGDTYFIDVTYEDVDCGNATNPGQTPQQPVGFGGSSSGGLHSVDQWRYTDNAPMPTALCGITIIVIDDIVGPDGAE